MHQGTIQPVPQACSTCGYGPVQPREETYHDRYAGETITEAVWICPNCGSRFAQGIVSRVADPKNEK